MKNITSTSLLAFIISYFNSISFGSEAEAFFTAHRFKSALVLNLPGVCLIPKNRPAATKGNQTHIHVTGPSREFFFDKAKIAAGITSNIDEKRKVSVSLTNIKSLNKLDLSSATGLDIVETTTNIKYSVGHQSQVQVSKIRSDGKEFIDLRNGLHLHDLLIFLKDEDDEMFAIGIPKTFYETNYDISDGLYLMLESKGVVTLKTVLSNIENSVDADTIVTDEDELADILYQQLVDNVDDEEVDDKPDNYQAEDYAGDENGRNVHSNRPSTNAKIGKSVIKANKYQCIFATDSDSHETFLKPNNKPYMEAHHLIPLSKQSKFKKKLDTKGNIVPVCPLCHRKLHHGRKSDVSLLLNELYTKRNTALKSSGLDITLDDLKSYYGCK